MVFYIHEELRRSSLITAMEEISDVSRISDMCVSTLKSMIGCKRYRKYLYHIETSAMTWRNVLMYPCTTHFMNKSNNMDFKKKQMAERVFGKTLTKRPSVIESYDITEKRVKEPLKAVLPTHKVKEPLKDMLPTHKPSKFDDLLDINKREHELRSTGQGPRCHLEADESEATDAFGYPSKMKGQSSSYERTRKDSIRPQDSRYMQRTEPSTSTSIMEHHSAKSSRKQTISGKETPMQRLSFVETINPKESDTDLAMMANIHLTQRQLAIKLLAEIQQKMDRRVKTEDDLSSKSSHSITPQEALQCAWLRLSKEQVETLEELIRLQGKDPGIHAHSDVTNYDVFAEIREIRRREKFSKRMMRINSNDVEDLISIISNGDTTNQ